MTERTSIFEILQLGKETTPGTAVAATKRLGSITVKPKPKVDVQTFRPDGFKFPLVAQVGKDWVEAAYEGVPDYNELVYILCSVLKTASPTGAGTAKTWTLTPDTDGADARATYTMESGSSVRAMEWPHGLFTTLSLQIDRQAAKISGKVLGQEVSDGITLTGALADPAPVPLQPDDVTLYLDTTGAGLGTTKLTRVLAVQIELDSGVAPVWVVDASEPSFVTVVEGVPKYTCKLKVEGDATGMGLLTTLRAGSTVFLRLKAIAAVLAESPSTYYSFQLDLALKVVGIADLADADGVYAVEYDCEVVHDATWGKALEAVLVTTLTAL